LLASQCEAERDSPLLDEFERLQAGHIGFFNIMLAAVSIRYAQQGSLFLRAQIGGQWISSKG
jgi:hypothetical protein